MNAFAKAALFGAALAAQSAWAQDFPSKPLRFVVPAGPGVVADSMTRLVAAKLTERLGWSTMTENRPGGDQIPAILAVTQAPADGYSILLGSGTLTILPSTKKDLPYDLVRDLVPVVRTATIPAMIAVHPSVAARDLKELVAWSKANPGKLSYGGTGTGTNSHLLAELFRSATGTDFLYVPYKDPRALTIDVLDGRLSMVYSPIADLMESVRQGKLRPLVVFAPARNAALPGVPTAAEASGQASLDTYSYMGYMVRTGGSAAITERLERELLAVARAPEFRDQLNKMGLIPEADGAAQFRTRMEGDLHRWERLIREGKLKFD